MKPGTFILVLLILALVAVPFAAYSDGSSPATAGPSRADGGGAGHAYRYGGGPRVPVANGMGTGQGQGHGPMPYGARNGQERSAASQVQQELQRDPFDWNTPVRRVLLRGYRRLSGKNILDHEKRQLIYTTILLNPGIEIPALASLTGINLHTLRYHIAYLIRMKTIACIEQGGGYHFFENHGRYGHADQQQILFQEIPDNKQHHRPGGRESRHHPGRTSRSVWAWPDLRSRGGCTG